MTKQQETHDVGVIVGRFQVHELHSEHLRLIDEVLDRHDKILIFLGLSPLNMVTVENPLDFEARKQMILEEYPDVIVQYIKDMYSDELWSKKLDGMISDLTTPKQRPMLYGGRDSFIEHYCGQYPTTELEPETYVRFSGTDVRKEIASRSTKASPDFRAGVVWASQSGYANCRPTVDVAVWNDDCSLLLLVKKPHEDLWRFIGGFAEADSFSLEADARREVAEEVHLSITDPRYITSMPIDDWRFRRERDGIKTTFFEAKKLHGQLRPDDDIAEASWHDWDALDIEQIVPSHRPLFEALRTHKHSPIKSNPS